MNTSVPIAVPLRSTGRIPARGYRSGESRFRRSGRTDVAAAAGEDGCCRGSQVEPIKYRSRSCYRRTLAPSTSRWSPASARTDRSLHHAIYRHPRDPSGNPGFSTEGLLNDDGRCGVRTLPATLKIAWDEQRNGLRRQKGRPEGQCLWLRRPLRRRWRLARPGAHSIPPPSSRWRPPRPSPLAGRSWFSQRIDSRESLIAPSARGDAPPPRVAVTSSVPPRCGCGPGLVAARLLRRGC